MLSEVQRDPAMRKAGVQVGEVIGKDGRIVVYCQGNSIHKKGELCFCYTEHREKCGF